MRRSRESRRLGAVLALAALFAGLLAGVSAAAATPVDVSGPVDGSGPGLAVTPATAVAGSTVTLSAENLPDATEAAAWVDDGDFAGEIGTYAGDVAIALCGNADSLGAVLAPGTFDPAVHCDGGDARSASLVTTATAAAGAVSTPVLTRNGTGSVLVDDDGDPGTPPVAVSAGIGTAEATCVVAAEPCRLLVRDAGATPGSIFEGTATFTAIDPPDLALVSVVGQAPGATAARAGNALEIAGDRWDPASGLAVVLCDPADLLACDPSSSTAGLTIDGAGALSGTVPVEPTNTTGARVLKVSQPSGAEALLGVRVLGARSIIIDPTGGPVGTAVNITGTDFDPLQPVTVTGFDGANPTTDVGAATVDVDGALTGSIIIDSPATVAVRVTEDDAPLTEGAEAPFAALPQSQVGEITVSGAGLTLTQAAGQISMGPITLSGAAQTANGAVQTVTINDSRGTFTGWSVTATASDWVDIADPDPANPMPNHVIPAANLTWTPSCQPEAGSTADPAEVVVGPVAPLDPLAAATMCSAAPGGGGGAWLADAALALDVPASIAAATYRATLTIMVS